MQAWGPELGAARVWRARSDSWPKNTSSWIRSSRQPGEPTWGTGFWSLWSCLLQPAPDAGLTVDATQGCVDLIYDLGAEALAAPELAVDGDEGADVKGFRKCGVGHEDPFWLPHRYDRKLSETGPNRGDGEDFSNVPTTVPPNCNNVGIRGI